MSVVLTIDFDIVMAPSIGLYNDIIGDQKGIDSIIKQYPLMEYTFTADFFIYEAVTRALMNLFKKVPAKDVYFIKEHHSLIKLVEDMKDITLINIDHHHDIGYNRVLPTTKILRPECGNWVKYLSDKGLIKSYIWVNNENSDMPTGGLSKMYLEDEFSIKDGFDISGLEQVDKLIICNSPQWIPPNVQGLFMTWIGLAEEFYDTSFKII